MKEIAKQVEKLTGIEREDLEDSEEDVNRSSYSIAQQKAETKKAEDSEDKKE